MLFSGFCGEIITRFRYKWLIQQGCDLNICAYDEDTALYYSIDHSPGIL